MRIRNFSGSDNIISNCSFLVSNPEDYRGKWSELFGNDNPIHLEIGMGKGKFLLENAINNPDINYIGVERYDTIVAKAIEKIQPYELINLRIIKEDAFNLAHMFDREIAVIYLNHSDPWPKARHEKRRLTSHNFLAIYDNLFKGAKKIVQKTDNYDLFEYSLESLELYGYEIIDKSYDLAGTKLVNYTTEYEEKFMKKGVKINYLVAVRKD